MAAMLEPADLPTDPASDLAQDLQALDGLPGEQFRPQARDLIERLNTQLKFEQTQRAAEHAHLQAQLKHAQAHNQKLNFELARLKQWRFGSASESLEAAGQLSLLDAKTGLALVQEALAEDRAADAARQAAREAALAAMQGGAAPARPKAQAKRVALPSQLERIEHHYEINPAVCAQGHGLKLIGQEISEQLDCVPAKFFVHRHIRGKYACAQCQTVQAATMPAQIIDKGIPAAGLLAQVIIAKHDDHLPLYRQEEIYRRSGAFIARASMATWIGTCGVHLTPLVAALRAHLLAQAVLHADETPVKLLAPGTGKTDTAYVWAYRSSDLATGERSVVYDFADSRAGAHARAFLQDYAGTVLTDDFAGYKALYASGQVKEAGCWAHARRKYFEAHKLTDSAIALQALQTIQSLYLIERQASDLSAHDRLALRQQQSQPLLDGFKVWLIEQRLHLANADATAKAIDYTLKRWAALTLHLNDPKVPIDNNAVENAMRPIALGRKNWLFVGSQQAGERAATLMSLIESAKLNSHDAWAYLKDVLDKLPTWPNSRIEELLPHRWVAPEG
jgi:transposase